jgi:hypothetical protein
MLIVGGGTASAADIVLIDCDKVSGSVSAKPGLTDQQVLQTLAFSSPKLPGAGQYPRECTGPLSATTGPLVSVKGKVSGIGSCVAATGPVTDPTDGKLDFTWTTVVADKPLKSSAYIRLGAGSQPDAAGFANGIVTKGPGVGTDVKGELLQAPVKAKGPAGSAYSTLAADGTLVFGQSSQDLGLACVTNAPFGAPGLPAQSGPLTELIFSTDGQSSLPGNPVVDSSISFTLPE